MEQVLIDHPDYRHLSKREICDRLVQVAMDLKDTIEGMMPADENELVKANQRFINLMKAGRQILIKEEVPDTFIRSFFAQLDIMNLAFKGKHL